MTISLVGQATGVDSDNLHAVATLGSAPTSTQVILTHAVCSSSQTITVSGCGATWVQGVTQTNGQYRSDIWYGYGPTGGTSVTATTSGAAYVSNVTAVFDGLKTSSISLLGSGSAAPGNTTAADMINSTGVTASDDFLVYAAMGNESNLPGSYSNDAPRSWTTGSSTNRSNFVVYNNTSWLICTASDSGVSLRRTANAAGGFTNITTTWIAFPAAPTPPGWRKTVFAHRRMPVLRAANF